MYEFHSYAAFDECTQEVKNGCVVILSEITVKQNGNYETHPVEVCLPSEISANDTSAVIEAMAAAMPAAITKLLEQLNSEGE